MQQRTLEPSDTPNDTFLIEALRNGDERAFMALVDRYQDALLRLAGVYVSNPAVAEEVVQDTWLGVLRGIDRFEARSSLKTWIFRILVNIAKTRGVRESRSIPFSALGDGAGEADELGIDPERFLPADDPTAPGTWLFPPQDWEATPESILVSAETRACVLRAIDILTPNQREVITLRDIQGWTSAEVCNVLDLTETNQRVLLHRARSRVRRALEQYFASERDDRDDN